MTFNPLMEISNDPMHQYFLKQAYKAAIDISSDMTTKVGAVIVEKYEHGHRMIARGANYLRPETRQLSDEEIVENLQNPEWKGNNMVHAEKAVIEMAKSCGYDINGRTMYMPWVPCGECGDKIMDSGITKLVTHKAFVLKTPERWWDSTNKGLEKLKKKGIELIMYDGKIGEVQSVFNSQVWFP